MSVSLIFNAWHKRGFRFQKQKQIKSQRGVVVRHPSTPLLSHVSVQCSRPLTYPLFHVQRQQPVLGVKHMTSSCDDILWRHPVIRDNIQQILKGAVLLSVTLHFVSGQSQDANLRYTQWWWGFLLNHLHKGRGGWSPRRKGSFVVWTKELFSLLRKR